MSDLRTFIRESYVRNKELTGMTVRVPNEVRSFIEEFADNMGLSKQDVMLKLLEAGIQQATEEIENLRDNERPSNFHILNTNKAHGDDDQEMMLNERIAAAFYAPWKNNIDRLNKGDVVFLYENGRGIIAYGKASGELLKRSHHGNADECHYQKLSDFYVLEQPLPASEIKKILGRNQVFLRTMSGMPDGDKVLEKIKTLREAQGISKN